MVELPKTEAELQALIDERVSARETELKAEYDNKFANQRKQHQVELDKAKADAGKTAEELAEQRIKEQQDADQKELQELRAFKKTSILTDRLAKEGLPSFFKNDSRLLTAEDGDIDKVIKDIKKEYEANLPKGNHYSNVVPQGGATPKGTAQTEKEEANAELGAILTEALKR